jgi:CHAT domain-containing protein/tetratricopeptide (TPR) repeat protein
VTLRRAGIAWLAVSLLALAPGFASARQALGFDARENAASPPPTEAMGRARSAARQGRWIEAEASAREVLVGQPFLNPDLGTVDEAFDLVVRARTSMRATRSESLAALASLDTLAEKINLSGRHAIARRMVERTLMLRGDSLEEFDLEGAGALSLFGIVCSNLDDNEDARRHFEDARAVYIRLLGPESMKANVMTMNLGISHYLLGDLSDARLLLEQAGDHFDRTADLDHQALVQINLGDLLTHMSDPLGARRASIRSAELYSKLGYGLGDALENLAISYMMTGENERALSIMDSVWVQYRSTDAEAIKKPEVARYRAQALESLGRLDEAEKEARRSVALYEQQLGPQHTFLVEPLRIIGEIRSAQGDWRGASDAFERSAGIDRGSLPPEHPWRARDLLDLARVRLALGDSARALDMALDAQERLRSHLVLTAPGLTGEAALRHDEQRARALYIALAALRARPALTDLRRALDAVVRSRAIVLELQSARLHAWGDSEIDSLRTVYERACTRLANLMVRSPADDPGGHQQVWEDSVRAARERAELELARRSARFSLDRAALAVGLEDVERAKPRESTLVAFVRYSDPLGPLGGRREPKGGDGRYLAFVVGRGGEITLHRLGSAREIEATVHRWREEAGGTGGSAPSEAQYRRVAARLRAMIWDPIEHDLDGSRSVFVVPDGALHLVNFGAMPSGAGGYLLERKPRIVYLSAERDLAEGARLTAESNRGTPRAGTASERTSSATGGLLVVGGPDFDSATNGGPASPPLMSERGHEVSDGLPGRLYRSVMTPCPRFAELRVHPLPGTLEEAREIASLWRHRPAGDSVAMSGFVETLTGESATEADVKRLAPGREVLHLATHGFFLEAACDSSAANWDASAANEGALLRAGLALTGFNRRKDAPPDGEDGVLTAEEVAAMDLRSVRCVVLSACESGVGDVVAGEGVFGLRRAFRLAGARTLVTSLWKIDDQATRYWSESFYRAFLGGASPADAAAAASRTMLNRARARGDGGHPHAWGAFVAFGDSR